MLNVGIGLTSKCNCNCDHCYSRTYGNSAFLDKDTLFAFFDSFDIESVNFGTGESYYHHDYIDIVRYLYERNVKVSVTTNGYTVSKMSDKQLQMLHDVDFSLDYPTEELHDGVRQKGCFKLVRKGVSRCKELGITCSIAWCLTPENCEFIRDMYLLSKKWDVFLRINIYKPVEGKKGFTYDLFWKSINELLKWGDIISISESIVNAAINNSKNLTGCNPRNFRIFPDGTMSSCVYVPNEGMTVAKACGMTEEQLLMYFYGQYQIERKSRCYECDVFGKCGAGCMARRKIANSSKDEFCYMDKDVKPKFERIVFSTRTSDLFVHSNYICTLIMEPREDLIWKSN